MEISGTHIAIKVKDLDKAIEYYKDFLGLNVIREISIGNGKKIIFFQGLELHQIENSCSNDKDIDLFNFMHFGIEVVNIGKAVDELFENNDYPKPEINEMIFEKEKTRVKFALFKDEHGIEVELVEWFDM